MKLQKTFLLLLIIPMLSFSAHKYYLSLTQINFIPESKSVQIIINVFMDDIETALNKDYNIDLQLTTEKELTENDVYFEKYLNEKLHFKVNAVAKKFNYIGKEYDGELVYFYLEIEDISDVNQIEISNKILIKHFPKQENLIKSKVGKINKSVLLNAENYSEILKY
ncbi:MAG: Uncharacterised protein [Polaribacter sp. SA4-10]|jgi:hypothetical protein|nr:MAG: Uncharacterised protein [Polaribacter sp. SA4-10]|tara:strand:- start:5959 stop:6456 length:498 start_codon:yes stop_codon:yes gene_type:complete